MGVKHSITLILVSFMFAAQDLVGSDNRDFRPQQVIEFSGTHKS